MNIEDKRPRMRESAQILPWPIEGKPGLLEVDTTWGEIQPLQIANGVRTVDELEVNKYLEQRLQLIDARTINFYEVLTTPGAKNIPYNEIVERMDKLDRSHPAIFFCNGPQCPQSPKAIKNLLDADYPADKILYYRGGMHDWLTLGLPVVEGR